jgi:hypothetical protein
MSFAVYVAINQLRASAFGLRVGSQSTIRNPSIGNLQSAIGKWNPRHPTRLDGNTPVRRVRPGMERRLEGGGE